MMRILDKRKIQYNAYFYDAQLTDGVSVAAALQKNADSVFKTLVTCGSDKNHYVFVIHVAKTLDLKKAEKANTFVSSISYFLEYFNLPYIIIDTNNKSMDKILHEALTAINLYCGTNVQ